MLSAETRQQTLQSLSEETFDLVIVGGGITGAGVARDAASRGLKIVVIEASDFSSGTSSRSSKLVHGGIRYLENFEFGLVHEALTERKALLEIAPHMVHPLRFLMPIYKSSRVGRFKMALGMILYDLLSFFESPELHEQLSVSGVHEREPIIKTEGLTGGFIYSDAFMDDDRLVIETLRSAQSFGAEMVSYAKVEKITEEQDQCLVEIRDQLSGKAMLIKAVHVVGCVGPWTDLFGHQSLDQWKSILRPTKGVHLIFSKERLPIHQAVVMAVEQRIIFVIPRGKMVIVGTTDTDFSGDPSLVNTDIADVDYLLKATNQYFPNVQLTQEDIISCYSGVRPLVNDGASTEGKTSREHQILRHSPRITCVAGGKYTTYRSMAKEIVDTVCKSFPFEKVQALRPSRVDLPINPLATPDRLQRIDLQIERLAQQHQLPLELVRDCVHRHGEEAYQVFSYLKKLVTPATGEELYWGAEAHFSIDYELCLNLVDFYWRRSHLFLFSRTHGVELLPYVAQVFARRLGWSESFKDEQISAVHICIQRETRALR